MSSKIGTQVIVNEFQVSLSKLSVGAYFIRPDVDQTIQFIVQIDGKGTTHRDCNDADAPPKTTENTTLVHPVHSIVQSQYIEPE